jgi:hypothetical protein
MWNPFSITLATLDGVDDDPGNGYLDLAGEGEKIYITGRVTCNELGVCYGADEEGPWVWRPGEPVPDYLTWETWHRSKARSDDSARSYAANPGAYNAAFSATALETPLGVVTSAACLAVPLCRLVYGEEAKGYIVDAFFGEGAYDDAIEETLTPPRPGLGPRVPKGTSADARRVAEQRQRRAERRERQSREGPDGSLDQAGNPQKLSGEGFRDHENANRGPSGERPAGPDRRHNRERNVGIDEEHSRRPKGGFR